MKNQDIEDSIKSEQHPSKSSNLVNEKGDLRMPNLDESSSSLSGTHPRMRRVITNNRPSTKPNDNQSMKSTMNNKSKRKIEIEKLSNDDYDESYQDDEFENTIDSQSIELSKKLAQMNMKS